MRGKSEKEGSCRLQKAPPPTWHREHGEETRARPACGISWRWTCRFCAQPVARSVGSGRLIQPTGEDPEDIWSGKPFILVV